MHIFPPFAAESSPSPTSPATAFSAEFALSLLGPSTAMSQLWVQLRRLAPHVRTLLLTGNPDSGQEAAARLLLDLSPHPRRPFVVLRGAEAEDCLGRPGALNLLPSELFLFLPEVEKLSHGAQLSLLRVLRMRRPRELSVVAETAEDLRALVSTGSFSPELAESLGAVRLALPALAQRSEDIPMLLGQLLSTRSHALGRPVPQLSYEVLRAAMQHSWPGNLRELSKAAEFLAQNAETTGELCAGDLQRALQAVQTPRLAPAPVRMAKLDEVVREHICAVLRGCRGNKLRAAEVLGISRSTLYRMLDSGAQAGSLPLAS